MNDESNILSYSIESKVLDALKSIITFSHHNTLLITERNFRVSLGLIIRSMDGRGNNSILKKMFANLHFELSSVHLNIEELVLLPRY